MIGMTELQLLWEQVEASQMSFYHYKFASRFRIKSISLYSSDEWDH